MPVPANPKIYHIVHVDNLASIIGDGGLSSDAVMVKRGGPPENIGMPNIKTARLAKPVGCNPGTFVGEYVPFNFCPRSVMLNIIWYANHPHLTYRGGQQPIVHLEASLERAIEWAEGNGKRWAFSLANARAAYVDFYSDYGKLDEINWAAVASNDFRSPDVKEGKQAEFLMQQFFPWHLVERIGVHSQPIAPRVAAAMHGAAHRPVLEIKRDWYY